MPTRISARSSSRYERAKISETSCGGTAIGAKKAADFKAVWDQFKATRDEEIIPAIYKGNAGDARKIVVAFKLPVLHQVL